MLHRNVIFRGSDVTPHAIAALDVDSQRDFFNQLDAACKAPCEVLTIPHNTNYSWGLTFSRNDLDGADYTSDDLDRRARIERLFEVTQAKGTSECQISVGAADEDCNFGILFPACENNDDLRCARASSMLRNVLLAATGLGFVPAIFLAHHLGWELHGIWLAFGIWMLVRAGALAWTFWRNYGPAANAKEAQ